VPLDEIDKLFLQWFGKLAFVNQLFQRCSEGLVYLLFYILLEVQVDLEPGKESPIRLLQHLKFMLVFFIVLLKHLLLFLHLKVESILNSLPKSMVKMFELLEDFLNLLNFFLNLMSLNCCSNS
jgi:hypothetical protein